MCDHFHVKGNDQVMKFLSYRTAIGAGIALDVQGEYLGLAPGDAGFPGTIDELVRSGDASLGDAADMLPFQHIGILSLEFHVDKLSRPLL